MTEQPSRARLSKDDLYESQESFFSQAGHDRDAIQENLARARVVVVGGGVVGSHALFSLADSGVGTLRILDATRVEESNLSGNALLRADDVGRSRGSALKERVEQRNPHIRTEELEADVFSATELKSILAESDCALVCLDAPAPTLVDAVNEAALQSGTRWMIGQIYRGVGLVGPTVIPRQSPCYRCYELRRNANLADYEETMKYERRLREMTGIRSDCVAPGPLAAAVAAFVALDALRLLTAASYPQTVGRILHLDFFNMDLTLHRILRFPNCPACGYESRRRLPQLPQLPRRK
jgi:adenylyltransferase/sulfurtransferase